MAFCGKCGTQLSEGAKFCPKCGNPVGVTQNERETRIEREIPNESINDNNETEEEGLSSMEKIALGAAGVIAIFGICYGAFESHYIVTISILAIVAVGYCFIGGIERKHIWTTVLGSIVAVFLAMGVFSSDDKEEEKTQVEQKQETPAEKAAREKREKEERQKDKINEIKRRAEREGRILAQSVRYTESWLKHCQNSYISAFGTPSTDEDYKMYDVFKEEFRKSYFATLDAQQKMN